MAEGTIHHPATMAPPFPVVVPPRPLPPIGLGSAGISMTPAEFDAITDFDEEWRYELVRGVLVVNPIPSDSERGGNDMLAYLLLTYSESHPQGGALDGHLPESYVAVSNGRRRADRILWAGLGRAPNSKKDVPTIVVEFVSEGKRSWQRDYNEKRQEYIAIGVKEYWIIDRFERKMTVFRPAPAEPAELIVDADGVYRTHLLPGFELPLAQVLAAGDRWSGKHDG
jgi:Uma2 family endonuclease